MAENVECPVDFILINERKARLTAGAIFVLTIIYLFTGLLAIPAFLIVDFFVRGFNLGRYSPLNLLSDKLIRILAIKPKLIDQAPKRFSAKIGFIFSLAISICHVLDYKTAALIVAIVLATFALLESAFGFCAGCHVYSFGLRMLKKKTALYSLSVLLACISFLQPAMPQPAKPEGAFTIENYYKIKWGFADEFIDLWKANHYPLLKKAIEKGDIISVTAEKPMLHSGEDTRWDFKVTIVFKNSEKAFDATLTEPYKKALYPDADKLKRDEQHRFGLLISHWDVMVEKVKVD